MKITQLEYFCVAAKAGNLTEAAKQLNISQPALTSSFQRMEEELGISLFDRKGRNLVLSPGGQIVYRHASKILKRYMRMHREIDQMLSEQQNTVRMICSTHILSLGLMTRILEKMPSISIQTSSPLDKEAFERFDKHEIDLIVNHPIYYGDNTASCVLESDEMVVISSKSGRLAQNFKGDVALSDLSDYLFASYPTDTPLRIEFETLCGTLGFAPQIVFSANTMREMLPLILASDVIAYIPLRTLDDIHENDLLIHHVTDIGEMPAVGITWHTDRPLNPAAETVRSCILSYWGITDQDPDR